jgi:hypothetical protein
MIVGVARSIHGRASIKRRPLPVEIVIGDEAFAIELVSVSNEVSEINLDRMTKRGG